MRRENRCKLLTIGVLCHLVIFNYFVQTLATFLWNY